MTVTAPAVTFTAPGQVAVTEVELPDVAPGEVGVRTAFSGISQGTERWLFTGRYNHAGDDVAGNYPCFPGYQAAGVVEVVGEGVTDVAPGDHVMLEGTRFADPAVANPGPGLASHVGYLVAPRARVTTIPYGVDLADASLYRMAAVSRHGVRLVGVRDGDVVCVIGLGLIGQMAAQAARRAGAHVIAGDLIPARVEAAGKYSADVAVDVREEPLSEVLRSSAPDGADVVIDTTGISSMWSTALDLVRPEGRISLQGYYPDPISIEFHPAHLKRVTVAFPCGWDADRDGELAADLAAGRLSIGQLITHRFSYTQAAEAYATVLDHPEASIGMVFDWSR